MLSNIQRMMKYSTKGRSQRQVTIFFKFRDPFPDFRTGRPEGRNIKFRTYTDNGK